MLRCGTEVFYLDIRIGCALQNRTVDSKLATHVEPYAFTDLLRCRRVYSTLRTRIRDSEIATQHTKKKECTSPYTRHIHQRVHLLCTRKSNGTILHVKLSKISNVKKKQAEYKITPDRMTSLRVHACITCTHISIFCLVLESTDTAVHLPIPDVDMLYILKQSIPNKLFIVRNYHIRAKERFQRLQ